MSDLAIGIDLGTTNSCAAVYHNGTLTIIPNDEGSRTTVSCVAFTDTERLIGDAAKSLVVSNPENTIFDSKRMIGRRFDDPKIQQDMKTWQFQVVDEDGMPKIRTEVKGKTKTFTPEEISAMVLAKMKEIAESHLGKKVTDAVISVPACFNDSQRQATVAAGRIAGLNVIRIINEPTAAALAYKVGKNLQGIKTVLIFDLGGGTLDVSIIKIGDHLLFDVKSTAGDAHLGGEDFDNVLVAHFVEEFKTKHQRDLRTCPKAVRKLRIACESAKRTLSRGFKATIDLSCLFEGIDFHSKLTRAQFEGMCMDLFLSTLEPVKRALYDANMDKGSIDEVVLVGGSTKIPKIRKLLKIFFDGKEPSMPVNRDEAVAYGAALLAVEKIKKLKLVSILDVTPLTLGINTKGGVMLPIIKRNSLLPCQATQIYFTVVDNRSNINSEIEVYQGEQAMVKDNHLVGRFRIGVTPHQALPEGMLQFTLSFFLDMDGILNVVSDSDHIRGVTVFAHKIGLSSDEVDRLASEAGRFEREEKAQREDRDVARTELESFVNSVKLSVEHSSVDSLSATDRKFVISLCESFKAWIKFNALAKTEEVRGKITEARIRLTEFMTVDKAMDLRPDLLPDGDLIIDLEAE